MTAKRTQYVRKLRSLLDQPDQLEDFLLSASALPGPRANLELASAAADLLGDSSQRSAWLPRLQAWSALDPQQAPCNHPTEFLPFVAWQALGTLLVDLPIPERDALIASLRRAANDPRWRSREAVAIAWQRIATRDFSLLRSTFAAWLDDASPLEQRAILAALAEPALLSNPDHASFALSIADQIARACCTWTASDWSRDDRSALRKTLEYAPSVLVAAAPDQGFALLADWADGTELAWKKIVASNLRKARLARAFPDEVASIGDRLSASWDP